MSVSYELTYTGDGVTQNFAVIPDYIRKSHIQVYLNNVLTTAYTWFNDQTIRFDVAPAVGVTIFLVRRPPGDVPLNTFTGSVLSPTALNENFRQAAQLGTLSQDDSAEARSSAAAALQEAQDAKNEADQALIVAQTAFDRADEAATGVIADGAVTTIKLADAAVTTPKLTDSAVTENKLGTNSVTPDKIQNGAVDNLKLANDSVTEFKLANDAVTSNKILQFAVTAPKIAPEAVNESKLSTNAVSTPKIANAAVTTDKIANAAVSGDKIVSNAVTTSKIENEAVTEAKLGPQSVSSGKLATDLVLPGNPTAATQAAEDNSQRLATTAWVRGFAPPSSRQVSTGRGLTGGGNLTTDSSLSIPTNFINSGSSWSPTFSGLVNCSDPILINGHWTLVDSVVTFSGRIQCTVTSANPVSLTMTIPVNVGGFVTANQCLGNIGGVQANNPVSGSVRAEAGVNRVVLDFTGPSSGARSVYFTAQYSIS